MILCSNCEKPLRLSEIKAKNKRCALCISTKRVTYLLSDEYIKEKFTKKWSKDLYLGYGNFLNEYQINAETFSRYLKKISDCLSKAEKALSSEHQITEKWLINNVPETRIKSGFITSMVSFLTKEKILPLRDKNKRVEESIERLINKFPENFRRLIEVYYSERMFSRTKQIEGNARKPLSLKTIEADIVIYLRFIRWITNQFPEINTWRLLQEEHVNSYLLTLSIHHREIARKDITMLFKLAKKKRILTHVPINILPSREYPTTVVPLTIREQKTLARKISNNIFEKPLACLLTSFCFYHALTSREISSLKISQIDLEKSCIYFNERPPVYMTDEDLVILEKYAEERSGIKNINKKNHLFVSKTYSFEDNPVSNSFIAKYVREFSGYTPKILRISCLSSISAMYGSQYLIDAFGLSLTQASRYGKMEEYLVEQEVFQQRELFLEYSNVLNTKE